MSTKLELSKIEVNGLKNGQDFKLSEHVKQLIEDHRQELFEKEQIFDQTKSKLRDEYESTR